MLTKARSSELPPPLLFIRVSAIYDIRTEERRAGGKTEPSGGEAEGRINASEFSIRHIYIGDR